MGDRTPENREGEQDSGGGDDLLGLWERARRELLRRCAANLAQLRSGLGGFYGVEDFLQDAFVVFMDLVARYGNGAALWQAWENTLRHGGASILRRRPQRLWRRAEEPCDPSWLSLDRDGDDRTVTAPSLPLGAREALTQADEGQQRVQRIEELLELRRALRRLSPEQRQALYLLAIRGVPASEAARRMHAETPNAVHLRARRARAALRRQLKRASHR